MDDRNSGNRRFRLNPRSVLASLLAFLSFGAFAEIVIGNGKIETQSRELPAFGAINVGGSATLKVHRGAQKVEISCDSNILPYITTTVSDGELTIGFKPLASMMGSTTMQFEITLPELVGIRLSGSGQAYVDAFKGDSFSSAISGSGSIKATSLDYSKATLAFSGSGRFDVKVKAERFDMRCSGSSAGLLSGSAGRGEIVVSGSGRIDARDFAVNEARIAVSGSGNVEIRALSSLDVSMSGSGSVKYWGSPSVSQRTSGSGRIMKAGN
jgi:uncharacterized protein (AIM24 family)